MITIAMIDNLARRLTDETAPVVSMIRGVLSPGRVASMDR